MIKTSKKTITVTHLTLELPSTFDNFIAAFEAAAGKFIEPVLQEIDIDPEGAETKFREMAGYENLMIFGSLDHGQVLKLYGQHTKLLQYSIGNPLTAGSMTQDAPGAALYAPLRLVVYETTAGQLIAEYDLPSGFFEQFGPAVAKVGKALDQKLQLLIEFAATGGVREDQEFK